LRAPNVTLEFPGKRGQAARRKSVSTAYPLPAILSEGEQKVIAIADFLAEASLRTGSAPIVFDDPVTSLDYRRLQEVVKRISELVEKHQVIVFTHNAWFASDLLAAFESRPEDCTFYEVVESGGHKGVVTRGSHPRFDTISQVKGRINSAIQDAKAASPADQTAKVEAAYDHIRVWCELVVEGELLAKVTQRHQPNVAVTNLERIKPERLKVAIGVILPIFDKACRYIPGHSQPLDTLGVRPKIEGLIADWADLQEALKAYQAS
jgi:ABC-type glutathione transport system ATPase component